MSWSDQLELLKWGNIEINTQSCTDDYSRKVVAYDYPYKDGAELEDLGRQPRPSSFTAVFFGKNYLAELVDFLQEVDKGLTRTLQHPLFGQWEAKCVRAAVKHKHDARDFAEVDLEFLEDGVNTTIPDIASVGSAESELTEDIADLSLTYDELGEDMPTVPTLLDDAEQFIADVNDQITDLTARFDRLKKSASEAVAELQRTVTDSAGWQALKQIRRIVNSAAKLKERIERLAPKISSLELAAHTPLVAIATAYYGDPSRADDLLRINSGSGIRNPFLVKPGTPLRVYTE